MGYIAPVQKVGQMNFIGPVVVNEVVTHSVAGVRHQVWMYIYIYGNMKRNTHTHMLYVHACISTFQNTSYHTT